MSAEVVFVARLLELAEERRILEERRSVPGFDASGLSEVEWQAVSAQIAEIEAEEQALARELRALLPALGISPAPLPPLDDEDDEDDEDEDER